VTQDEFLEMLGQFLGALESADLYWLPDSIGQNLRRATGLLEQVENDVENI
jgi:hypothetical protein